MNILKTEMMAIEGVMTRVPTNVRVYMAIANCLRKLPKEEDISRHCSVNPVEGFAYPNRSHFVKPLPSNEDLKFLYQEGKLDVEKLFILIQTYDEDSYQLLKLNKDIVLTKTIIEKFNHLEESQAAKELWILISALYSSTHSVILQNFGNNTAKIIRRLTF